MTAPAVVSAAFQPMAFPDERVARIRALRGAAVAQSRGREKGTLGKDKLPTIMSDINV